METARSHPNDLHNDRDLAWSTQTKNREYAKPSSDTAEPSGPSTTDSAAQNAKHNGGSSAPVTWTAVTSNGEIVKHGPYSAYENRMLDIAYQDIAKSGGNRPTVTAKWAEHLSRQLGRARNGILRHLQMREHGRRFGSLATTAAPSNRIHPDEARPEARENRIAIPPSTHPTLQYSCAALPIDPSSVRPSMNQSSSSDPHCSPGARYQLLNDID